ncbi:hypothetical protein [Methylobacterium currus]|uniref:hypothetical protein n=1 Tax=Methylobacterium currus TaxID=2051553 RepID=UPI000F5090B2|nr:hypothetical protein [Methylobacterium currus]
MPKYEVRLYKQSGSSKNMHQLVDRIQFDAIDDADAISRAPNIDIQTYDNSDYAILFGEDMHTLWRIDADRD